MKIPFLIRVFQGILSRAMVKNMKDSMYNNFLHDFINNGKSLK